MFRLTQEPSSGSYSQCLAKVTSLAQQCVSVRTTSAPTLLSAPTRTVKQDL